MTTDVNRPVLSGHQPRTENQSSAAAVILLLPVLAILCYDIVLIYYQYALAPAGGVANTVSQAALTNTAWVLDKITIGGGVILLVMALKNLLVTQSMSLFLLCAVALAVHLASAFIVDTSVVTPFVAAKALALHW